VTDDRPLAEIVAEGRAFDAAAVARLAQEGKK
jgi:hypothetical protein